MGVADLIMAILAPVALLLTIAVRSFRKMWLFCAVYKKYDFRLPQGCEFRGIANIELGRNFGAAPYVTVFADSLKGVSSINIGDNVHLERNVMINAHNEGEIRIGSHVRIGPNCVFRASNHRFDGVTGRICEQGHTPGKIVVEDDVWLGAGVIVLPDVSIGKGAVIGAGAVVAKDIPEAVVAVGIPARPIRSRVQSDLF